MLNQLDKHLETIQEGNALWWVFSRVFLVLLNVSLKRDQLSLKLTKMSINKQRKELDKLRNKIKECGEDKECIRGCKKLMAIIEEKIKEDTEYLKYLEDRIKGCKEFIQGLKEVNKKED